MKSQNAPAASDWIELRRSRSAQILRVAFYALVVLSVASWAHGLWQSLAYLLVLICYWIDFRGAQKAARERVALSASSGIVAIQQGEQIRAVLSFKVEHILCYYMQIHLTYDNGAHHRLYLFPDSMKDSAFHQLRCMCMRYKGAAQPS